MADTLQSPLQPVRQPPAEPDTRCRDWAVRATRFDERAGGVADEQRASRLLAQWCRHYADGNSDALLRRLQWDGWTEADALPRLAPAATETESASVPAWATWLAGQLDAPWCPASAHAPTRPADALWTAWVERAWRRAGLGSDAEFHRATAALRDALADRLAACSAGALAESTQTFIATGAPAHHDDWLGWLCDGRLAVLFDHYPVLARQLAELTIDVLDAAAELATRLRDDRIALGRRFGLACSRPPCAIEPAGGDPHRRGRQVLRLRFDGVVLYYKPRPLAAEAAFHRCVEALAADGLDAAPPTVALLDCGDHGYVAAATQCVDALDAAELQRWHRRAGGLIALAWLFNARDLHQDNIVATAVGPLPIDLETILQPALPEGLGTFDRAQARIAESCLASGLLRFPQVRSDGRSVDASGLRGEAAAQRADWHGVDALQFRRTVRRVDAPLAHRLYAAGRPIDPVDHAEAVLDGFRQTLRHVADRPELVSGPIQSMAALSVRVVFRPSQAYADLLHLLATPALQKDGAHSIIAIDRLNRVFAGLGERPAWWPLTTAERTQLEAGDVPLFVAGADASGFPELGIDAMFARSGIGIAQRRLAELDQRTIDAQSAMLAAALRPERVLVGERPERAAPLDRDSAFEFASAVADTLLAAAVRGADGLVTWLQPESLGRSAPRGFGADYYLYHGSLGIAWMLAALHRCRPLEPAVEAVAAVVASLRRISESPSAVALLAAEPCGAAHGLGSLMLGLLAIDRIDTGYGAADVAQRFADGIVESRIAGEPDADLHGGIAGLLLALAAMQRRTGDPNGHARAAACAARLHTLSDARGRPLGYGEVIRTGAAHGLSGIAFALAHAAHAFERDDWLRWAHELTLAEDAAFDTGAGNWRSSLSEHTPTGLNTWCNGATGLLLLRAAAGLWRDDEREAAALAKLPDAPCAAVDHLCCGVLGRAESLVELGRLRADPGLAQAGQGIAAAVVARGAPRLDRGISAQVAPGLFRGSAGIALSLLRTHVDAALPSPLLFGMESLSC